ncbi:hypothetical protein ACL02T_29720 [Pseudonocardia sp. RS010]|uniref:hypothetical protein n=1 Tax=Pseudonocardia sp. RS010 TaxID=3385979 RepID=UPI0039A32514
MAQHEGVGLEEGPTVVVVDGQEFIVQQRSMEQGTYDFNWTTGPNPNYGFSSSGWNRRITLEDATRAIRDFLRQVNPQTGYIED